MKYFCIQIALLCLLAASCKHTDTTGAKSEIESEDSLMISNDLEVETKAKWETEDFLMNSDAFEKDLSEKAKKGDTGAMMDLGMMFIQPKLSAHFKQDEESGIYLLTQSANKGNAEAQWNLARIYFGSYFNGTLGSGQYKDMEKTHKWLELSAENGFPGAELGLAESYSFGKHGYPQDYAKSLKWYKRFAVRGTTKIHAGAQYNVGWQYLYGKGVEEDIAEAMRWLGKSAANGNDDAMKLLRQYGFY